MAHSRRHKEKMRDIRKYEVFQLAGQLATHDIKEE